LRLADYGEPTIESILRYRAREVLGATGILLIFVLLTVFSLRARTAAVQSEREKAMFLAFMSHEIRTPLHTIFSSLELLQRSPLNAKQAEKVRTAVVASETLLELLDDLLEYSRLESRGLRLEQLATPIEAWAHQTIDMVRWRADEKRLTLSLDIACDPELILIIDPTRLRQIASNLLDNAIKFTESGTVKIRLDYLPSAEPGRPGELTLEVSDTGIGLSAEQQRQIFVAFRQADRSTPRRFGGTGLGLAICKELATRMHGNIAVSSKPGGVTSFTVRIPAVRVESAGPDATIFNGAPLANHPGTLRQRARCCW
jgi:two-component system sensor histidine kinase EvgS